MKFWQVIAALSAAGGGACVAKALARALFPATKPQNRFRRVLADPRNDLPFPHHRRRTLSAGADGRAAVPTSSSPACHPYALEINSLIEQARAATAATLSAVAPPLLLPPPPPLPLEQTPLVTVSTRRQLADLAQRLLDVDEFAVDVEHHAYRSYLGLTCLVQISTRDAGERAKPGQAGALLGGMPGADGGVSTSLHRPRDAA